jgi:CelD/BcsL family acetyltransferase involved in cellulose biosynthesis/RimJ/RimL family protein N-acetyltransferase
MKVDLLEGEDALRQLRDLGFQQSWKHLLVECPWATVCQTIGFIITWYEVYQARFSPLIACGYSPNGNLVGFLPLTVSSDGKELFPAGAHQGEYHGWLASPDRSDEFIELALRRLANSVTQARLSFRCLPPLTPIDWVSRRPFWRRNCLVQAQQRPLLRLSEVDRIAESLRKKSNKSRLNRLKKLGELQFEQVTNLSMNAEELDSIISCYDLRIGAIADLLPFHDDPKKKEFYLKLLNHPNLLHMTILRVGKSWISAHIGGCDGPDVYLGILAYSPYFAKFSPAKFHIFKLAELLSAQGFSNFDLTPSGAYKDRFATHSDQVYGLQIFFRPVIYWSSLITRTLRRSISEILKSLGFSTEVLRERILLMKRLLRQGLFYGLDSLLSQKADLKMYEFGFHKLEEPRTSAFLAMNRLNDLFAFVPGEREGSRQEFLAEALQRIESGARFYTRVEQGRLIHCSWRMDTLDEFLIPELDQRVPLSPNSAVIFGFWTHPRFRNEAFARAALLQLLHDAAAHPANKSVVVFAPGDDQPALHILEELGGVHKRTLSTQEFFGSIRRQPRTVASSETKMEPEKSLSSGQAAK